MQIKTTVRHRFTPTVRKAMTEKIIAIVGEDVEKLKPLHTDGRNMRDNIIKCQTGWQRLQRQVMGRI